MDRSQPRSTEDSTGRVWVILPADRGASRECSVVRASDNIQTQSYKASFSPEGARITLHHDKVEKVANCPMVEGTCMVSARSHILGPLVSILSRQKIAQEARGPESELHAYHL